MCYLSNCTPTWSAWWQKIWIILINILHAILYFFFDRQSMKVQKPTEKNKAKIPNLLCEWMNVICSSVSFYCLENSCMKQVKNEERKKSPLFWFACHNSAVWRASSESITSISQSLRLCKDTEKGVTTRRNVCSVPSHMGWVQNPREACRAAGWEWGLHLTMQSSPPFPWVWPQAAEEYQSQQSFFKFTLTLWYSCLSEEATV